MSKERELLEKALDVLERVHMDECDLYEEIQELLVQPEQEPVAWLSLSDIEWMNIVNNPKILELTCGRHSSEDAVNLAVKMTEEKCKKKNSNSIPKREPLSDEEILKIYQDFFRNTFVIGDMSPTIAFAKAIEKAHGIGDRDA